MLGTLASMVVSSVLIGLAPSGRSERCPRSQGGESGESCRGLARHLACLNRLEHGTHVVAVSLCEADVVLNRLPVQTLRLRYRLCSFGKRSGQIPTGQIKTQTTAQERGIVGVVFKEGVLSFARCGKDPDHVRRNPLQCDQQLPNHVFAQTVRLVNNVGSALLITEDAAYLALPLQFCERGY